MDDLCYWSLGLSDKLGSRCDISEAAGHIEAGAKKVIISAPGKGDLKTLVSFQQIFFQIRCDFKTWVSQATRMIRHSYFKSRSY